MEAGTPHIAILTPYFFGYERDIAEEFAACGWRVTLLDERPSNSLLARATYRVIPAAARRSIGRHYEDLLKRLVNERPSHVLVIKAEIVPESFVRRLRAALPTTTVMFYAFDTLLKSAPWVAGTDLFDLAFSFDPVDVDRHAGLTYLPLFAGRAFDVTNHRDEERPLDVSFIGTVHSGRYQFVTALASVASTSFLHFYVPSRWLYFALYLTRDFRGVRLRDLTDVKLPRRAVADVFRRTRFVVDVERSGQRGLTMRTFEALASGARLVTTNPHARELLPQLSRDRVIVVDQSDVPGAVATFRAALTSPPPDDDLEEVMKGFTVENWVRSLMSAASTHRAETR